MAVAGAPLLILGFVLVTLHLAVLRQRDAARVARNGSAPGAPGASALEASLLATQEELSVTSALQFPLLASAMLTLLYVVVSGVMSSLLVLYFIVMGVTSASFAVVPLVRVCCGLRGRRQSPETKPDLEQQREGHLADESYPESDAAEEARLRLHTQYNVLVDRVATLLAALLVASWLFTGHWVAIDAMGVSLCITFLNVLRLPSLRVAVALLVGLFFFDIFWVFFSEYIFSENVMVEVATRPQANPARAITEALKLPVQPEPELQLPMKFLFPSLFVEGQMHMLGLGDVVIPGVVLAMLDRWDAVVVSRRLGGQGQRRLTYYALSLAAYAVGLCTAFYCAVAYQAAQPALLYLVPAVLLPTAMLALRRGELGVLWKGWGESLLY